jgi:lipoprotein-releasing system ATP-binding protein
MTLEAAALGAVGVTKRFEEGPAHVDVLNGIDLTVSKGDRVAIVGSSGSGKSTLLQILGGLDTPTSGVVSVAGENIATLSEDRLCTLRNKTVGFVYQFHHLLAEFSAQENVAIPLLVAGVKTAQAMERASELLERVGLGGRIRHKPSELSGGERQRAAIARALVNEPACVLADEPTGNLDRTTAASVFELMLELNQSHGTALVLVTHDETLAARMDRRLELVDGKFVS